MAKVLRVAQNIWAVIRSEPWGQLPRFALRSAVSPCGMAMNIEVETASRWLSSYSLPYAQDSWLPPEAVGRSWTANGAKSWRCETTRTPMDGAERRDGARGAELAHDQDTPSSLQSILVGGPSQVDSHYLELTVVEQDLIAQLHPLLRLACEEGCEVARDGVGLATFTTRFRMMSGVLEDVEVPSVSEAWRLRPDET